MIKYQVWTKQPGEEDYEMQADLTYFIIAKIVVEAYAKEGAIVQLTKTESENPNHYIRLDE